MAESKQYYSKEETRINLGNGQRKLSSLDLKITILDSLISINGWDPFYGRPPSFRYKLEPSRGPETN